MHDCAWYTPEHADVALRGVARLSREECIARRTRYGLRFTFDYAPIPDADGRLCGKSGTFVVRNFWGSSGLLPGVIVDGKIAVCARLKLTHEADGLVFGDFIEPVKYPKEEAEEAASQAQNDRMFTELGGMRAVAIQDAVTRWYNAAEAIAAGAPVTAEMKADIEAFLKTRVEWERSRAWFRRLGRALWKRPVPLTAQELFAYALYPELRNGGAPGYKPGNPDDSAYDIEFYYRQSMAQVASMG